MKGVGLTLGAGLVAVLHQGCGGGGDGAGGPGARAADCREADRCPAALGNVGYTTATGTDQRSAQEFAVGVDVYGPFEAGFTSAQDFVLEGLGCATGKGYVEGGIDTNTADKIVAADCGVELPREEGDEYIALLDECGGHTEYHFHERLSCLYDASAEGHSTQVAEMLDGQFLYGQNEDTGVLAELDACGGHFGPVPDASGTPYHYHVQERAPFTVGCFGPNADGTEVTYAQCYALFEECGNGDTITLTLPTGDMQYDLWCPCYHEGSNTVDPSTVAAPTDAATTAAPTDAATTAAPTTVVP